MYHLKKSFFGIKILDSYLKTLNGILLSSWCKKWYAELRLIFINSANCLTFRNKLLLFIEATSNPYRFDFQLAKLSVWRSTSIEQIENHTVFYIYVIEYLDNALFIKRIFKISRIFREDYPFLDKYGKNRLKIARKSVKSRLCRLLSVWKTYRILLEKI